MKKLLSRKIWMQLIAVILVFAMNLGLLDGIANGILKEMYGYGLTKSPVQVNSVPKAYADPGEGSFSPTVFDPNHNQTSTLTFKFDYDHYVKIELFKGSTFIKTLSNRTFFDGRLDDPEDETPEDVTNYYTWDGKHGGEPLDDGKYTIILTPLDEWSIYPLDADVTIRNVPHTPVIKGISINQDSGTVTINGTSQPNHVIHLYNRGNYFFSTTADSNGRWWVYNKPFNNGQKNIIMAKAENKVRNWPTLSAPSTAKTFLTYQIKQNDKLWNIASFYLIQGKRYVEIQQATGLNSTAIYPRKWLLVMDPLREGIYNNVDTTEKILKDKTNGPAAKVMGDPINSVTGNYYTHETDLYIPGRGLSFEFTRTYNTQSGNRGQMGFRWDFSFNKSLIFYTDGIVGYARGDGGIDFYTPDGTGKYISPPGIYDILQKRQDDTYYLTLKDRTVYNFDNAGRLTSMADRNGNTITVSYNEDGQISHVTDTVGRRINFVYDNNQRIIEINDPQNRKVKYAYDENSNLTVVTDVNGGITRYEYDENHFIVKSTDPKGYIIIENTYDSEGRVLTQKDGKGHTSYYSYDTILKTTRYYNNKGVETVFKYDGEYRPTTEIRTTNNTKEIITYDTWGNKASVTDFKGNKTYYGYDSKGNLTGITDPAGKHVSMTYDNNDNLTCYVDARGYITIYKYDAKGNLTEITDPEGKSQKYHYNNNGQPVKMVDRYGSETVIEYDGDGNISQVTDPLGNRTVYGYDKAGRVTTVKDGRGNTTKISYDNKGQITQTTSPLDQSRKYKYDLNGNLAEITDAKGSKTLLEYDSMDNLVKVTDPLGQITSMEYDKNNNRTKIINPSGGKVEYKYDELDRVTEISDPLGAITKFEYDANDNVVSVTDPKGNKTRYQYDSKNRITAEINALDLKNEFAYDELGNLVKRRDPKGAETWYHYDRLSRLTKIINALGQTTRIHYDDDNKEKTVTDARGNSYRYKYDASDNLVTVTDPLGYRTGMTYDGNNNLTELTDALNQVKKFEFDKANRLIKIIDPLENITRIEYDLNDNRSKVIDPENNVTEYRYDKLDRLVKVIDALGNATQYKYDSLGNLLELTDAKNNITRNEYDLKGRLLRVIDPVGKQKSFAYDLNDNLTEKTDGNGIATLYEYDALNRVTGLMYPGESLRYRYDEQGNRTVTEDVYGVTKYDYNLLGYLTGVTDPDGKRVSYEYNKTGQRSRITYPDGKQVRYFYDRLNRLNEVIDWSGESAKYEYDPIGRRTLTLLPNGTETLYMYDRASNLTSLINNAGSGSLLSRFDYTYDRAGNRISLTETIGDDIRTTNYRYDPLYQLTKATGTDGTETTYSYDAAGNRTEMARTAGETLTKTKYTYNKANELITMMTDGEEGPTLLDYDGNGNLVKMLHPDTRSTDYFYDPANRLVEVNLPQNKVVLYDYDADGNRTMKLTTKSPVKDIKEKEENLAGVKPAKPDKPDNFGKDKAKKQAEDNIFTILKNNSGGGGKSGGSGGGNSGNNGNNNNGNSGNNGNNGNGQDKDKETGYKGKGKFENRGKHLGWYKNGKFAEMLELGLNPQLVETTYYVNDIATDAPQVLMTYDEQDNYTAAYSYGIERIKVKALDNTRPESQDPLYYLHDGLGSTRQLVRSNGAIRDHYNYDEFGVPGPGAKLSEDGRNVNHNTFGYTGEMWDEEDDLLYLRSRYYAPHIGRFMTRDVFPGDANNPLSMHKYAYVENSPVNFVDPLGFEKKNTKSQYGYNDDIYKNYWKDYEAYNQAKTGGTVVFINSPKGVPVLGHEAIVIINYKNEAHYYSFAPESTSVIEDNITHWEFNIKNKSSSEIDKLVQNINMKREKDGREVYDNDWVKVDNISDININKMIEYAEKPKGYWASSYNCLNYVQGIVRAGGMKNVPDGVTPNPWHLRIKVGGIG